MKIYFGYPNPDSINKLSPALQALELNFLKAEPGKIALRGLHRIAQDGYGEYASNLAAFMFATERQQNVSLRREGYPVLTNANDVIPFVIPNIYVQYKGTKDVPENLKRATNVKSISVKDKTIKAYLIEYKAGIFGLIQQSGYETNAFPIANTIAADDLGTLITILRIISAFLRTHKYPAFPTNNEFEYEYSKSIEAKKRVLAPEDVIEFSTGTDVSKRQLVKVKEDGEPTWVVPETTDDKVEVCLRKAKPSDITLPAWGDASQIPNTDGIVFPYVEDLAVWDKETVPSVIANHFVRCLGHTTEGALKQLSDLSLHWKKSLFRSPIGNVLSHLFRVAELAIPCQARVFPVIQSNTYYGCYLSGSGFSVALKSELHRPTTFSNNTEDFDCFDSMNSLLAKIGAKMGIATDEKAMTLLYGKGSLSMRELNNRLKTRIISIPTLGEIRTLAARIRYPQEFLRINMTNIQWALTSIASGKEVDSLVPMHASALGRTSVIELVLSAFGPTAPSPTIPGAQKISITPKPPPAFNKVLAFRTTTLETAVSDWKDFGEKGILYNGPDRLSSRYQYTQVRGEEERLAWFATLNQFHVWYKAKETQDLTGNVVAVDDDDDIGGALLNLESGPDLAGF